jgi:regulator of sirC expression with transglutaminase-like and TPR domain
MTTEKVNKELQALVRLLDEPNDSIYSTIRDKIFSYGASAIPVLEDYWENSFDHLIQERIEDLIHHIQLTALKSDLKRWKENHQHDLLKGYLLVTRFQYPDLEEDRIIRDIGRITQDVWLELNNDLTGLEKVKVINHILFDIYNFSGNRTNLAAVDNFYLKNLLESKKGNAISLAMIYLIVAQSLKMPIYGINLPKHFIVGYSGDPVDFDKNDNEVMFYLNPFNRGTVFTRHEVELFVQQIKLKKRPEYFRPCDNISTLKRLCEELAIAYDLAGNKEKAGEMRDLYTIL